MTVWYAECTLHTRQQSSQNNKYQLSQKHKWFSWWWAYSRSEHVEIDKYTKNKFVHQISFIYKIIQSSTVNNTCTLYHRQHDFRKKKLLLNIEMCILIFPTTFVWNISHSKKYWAGYNKKCILVLVYSTFYSCHILMKIEFSRQIFEKYSNIKFHENPSNGNRGVPYGRTDGRTDRQADKLDEANSHFRNFA